MGEYLNQYINGDSRTVLKYTPSNICRLVYIDPPYNTGRDFYHFNDKFSSISEYINELLKPIIVECRRILTNDGNIVCHIEPKISHYVRMLLDDIFGIVNFKNEIVWKSGGNKKSLKQLARFHDTILVYGKCKNSFFKPLYMPYDDEYRKSNSVKICSHHNKEYVTTAAHNSQPDVVQRKRLRYGWNGHTKQWYISKKKMQELHDDNRLQYNQQGIPRIKRFLDEMDGIPIRDLWTDISQIQNGEKEDYATQKPVKLLNRILQIYSEEGDVVLDPCAGSGTTGRSCIEMKRNYILVDINMNGKKLFEKTLNKKVMLYDE